MKSNDILLKITDGIKKKTAVGTRLISLTSAQAGIIFLR